MLALSSALHFIHAVHTCMRLRACRRCLSAGDDDDGTMARRRTLKNKKIKNRYYYDFEVYVNTKKKTSFKLLFPGETYDT